MVYIFCHKCCNNSLIHWTVNALISYNKGSISYFRNTVYCVFGHRAFSIQNDIKLGCSLHLHQFISFFYFGFTGVTLLWTWTESRGKTYLQWLCIINTELNVTDTELAFSAQRHETDCSSKYYSGGHCIKHFTGQLTGKWMDHCWNRSICDDPNL